MLLIWTPFQLTTTHLIYISIYLAEKTPFIPKKFHQKTSVFFLKDQNLTKHKVEIVGFVRLITFSFVCLNERNHSLMKKKIDNLLHLNTEMDS